MLQRIMLLPLLLSLSLSVMAAQDVKIFSSGSHTQILEQRKGKSFMLVLWSLDCPPCYKELAMLSEVIKKQPQLDLVLVSTDTTGDISDIQQKLNKFRLNNISAWVFDNNMAQQLRYEIDPNWYGELPRSYLFDAKHNRQVISGVLGSMALQQWKALHSRNVITEKKNN